MMIEMEEYMEAPVMSVFEYLPEMILLNTFPKAWIVRSRNGKLFLRIDHTQQFCTKYIPMENKNLFRNIPKGYFMSAEEALNKSIPCNE